MDNYEQKSVGCPTCDEPMNPGGICQNCNYDDPAEGDDKGK